MIDGRNRDEIWIAPRELGLSPSVEQRGVRREERLNRFMALVSSTDPGALAIQQDAKFVVSALEPGQSASYKLSEGCPIAGRRRENSRRALGGGDGRERQRAGDGGGQGLTPLSPP